MSKCSRSDGPGHHRPAAPGRVLPAVVRPALPPGRRATRAWPAGLGRAVLAGAEDPGRGAALAFQKAGSYPGQPGRTVRSRSSCTWTPRCPLWLTWRSSMSGRWRSAPGCSRTTRMTRRSRCGYMPILRGIRSASLSADQPHTFNEPGCVRRRHGSLCRRGETASAPFPSMRSPPGTLPLILQVGGEGVVELGRVDGEFHRGLGRPSVRGEPNGNSGQHPPGGP